jgi:hypothetical protein
LKNTSEAFTLLFYLDFIRICLYSGVSGVQTHVRKNLEKSGLELGGIVTLGLKNSVQALLRYFMFCKELKEICIKGAAVLGGGGCACRDFSKNMKFY